MKKLFAILAVSAFVFAACGQKAETEEPSGRRKNIKEKKSKKIKYNLKEK